MRGVSIGMLVRRCERGVLVIQAAFGGGSGLDGVMGIAVSRAAGGEGR